MTACHKLIDDFLKSTNTIFKISYKYIGKVNLNYTTGYYKNLECVMTKNDFDELSKNRIKYKQVTFKDIIYNDNCEYFVPVMIILTSK